MGRVGVYSPVPLDSALIPIGYITKVRIIIDTTKFFNEKKNKKNMLFYLVD
jgi:hypothetical protein